MIELRLDPWRPDFGVGAEVSFDEELARPVVDTAVETGDWSAALTAEPCDPEGLIFVDGVMRTEMRVMASDGDRRAWGLLGSCAAGAVLCDGAATFIAEDRPVRRALILGGRVEADAVSLQAGSSDVVYEAHSVALDTPQGLRTKLQRLMLEEEQLLASELAGRALVFADGPLHLDLAPEAVVVGVVKRMVKAYLEGDEARLLPRLVPGQRTPLFAVGSGVVDRYAWYQRLTPVQPAWHELAGLVRCEVRMAIGLAEARRIADRVAHHLPGFAGRPGLDPRAPQNLTPVGALEQRLKHRLGSSLFIGRALTTHLAEALNA